MEWAEGAIRHPSRPGPAVEPAGELSGTRTRRNTARGTARGYSARSATAARQRAGERAIDGGNSQSARHESAAADGNGISSARVTWRRAAGSLALAGPGG